MADRSTDSPDSTTGPEGTGGGEPATQRLPQQSGGPTTDAGRASDEDGSGTADAAGRSGSTDSSTTGSDPTTGSADTEPSGDADRSGEADAAAGSATRPVRSVPGGVGVPGRAAPRRVLRADEPMPGEELPRDGESRAREGGDDSPTTTLSAQPDADDDTRTTAVPAAAAAGGSRAWSAQSDERDAPATSRLDGHPDDGDRDEHDRHGDDRHGDDRPLADGDPHPSDGTAEDLAPVAEPKVRRGTGDLGLLVLRLALGADLVAHGLQKLPGLLGGSGIDGYEQLLSGAGYQQPGVLAYVGAISELGAGVLLVLGLLTPLGAAAAIGVLVNAWFLREATSPEVFPFFAGQGGSELELALIAMAVTVALAGPGRAALDARRRWATRPTWDGILAVLLGGGAGVGLWFALNGANPFG